MRLIASKNCFQKRTKYLAAIEVACPPVISTCSDTIRKRQFLCSAGAVSPSRPEDRSAARAAAVKTGRRPPPQAVHRGLDGHKHDATLDQVGTCCCVLPGSWFFPRSAGAVSRNLASGRLAPLCLERGQLDRERRNGELGVAEPRPGWDGVPPIAGGSRNLYGSSGCDHCGLAAPAKFAAVAPDPVHDDDVLDNMANFGAVRRALTSLGQSGRRSGRYQPTSMRLTSVQMMSRFVDQSASASRSCTIAANRSNWPITR